MLVFVLGAWGRPSGSKKNHFFDGGISLCDRWERKTAVACTVPGDAPGPDDCRACHQRWLKLKNQP